MKTELSSILTALNPGDEYFNQYFRLPAKIVTHFFDENQYQLSKFEAFLQIIFNVNHNDSLVYGEYKCCRGESYKSVVSWSKIFNWSKSKTWRFLRDLAEAGIAEVESVGRTTRLKLLHYDYYVGKQHNEATNTFTQDFEDFWIEYHRVLQIRATDKAAAFRVYKRLSEQERIKAREKVKRFYYNLGNTKYVVKAVNYLRNKNFNDQFLC